MSFEHSEWDWDYGLAALRASQLWKGTVTTAVPTTVYTVPAGKRAILKFVTAQNVGAATRDVQLRVLGPGTIFHWSLTGYGTGGDKATGTFWLVLSAGDQVQVNLNLAGTVTMTISGSEHSI